MHNLHTQPDGLILNDRDLLRRFVQDADQAAFAEIVRRHQNLVLGVCRRVLGHEADVDDAFQATFLALARRPRQIRKEVSLSSWLYTVAWRVSWRLVRQRRKNSVEPLSAQPLDTQPGPLEKIASAQNCLVLDEELNGLPSTYRDVLVMTYFAGQTNRQIADQLNISTGTVDGRIRQARNMLRVRLARRGVAIGVLAVAAGMSTGSSAVASADLLQHTIQLGAQALSGSASGSTSLSHLEPLVRPETVMISTKTILTGALCATAVIGVVGMNAVAQTSDEAAAATAQVQALDVTVERGTAAADERVAGRSEVEPVGGLNIAGGAGFGGEGFGATEGGIENGGEEEPVQAMGEGDEVGGNGAAAGGGAGDGNGAGKSGRFQTYPADARPVEKWMYQMLEQPVASLDFPGETPLSVILEAIEDNVTRAHGDTPDGKFRLRIYVDKGELAREGMTSLDDVQISDIEFDGMSLRNVLKLIFDQTWNDAASEVPLTYVIQNEVMLITTLDKAESQDMLITRIYPVADLLLLDYSDFATPAPTGMEDMMGAGGDYGMGSDGGYGMLSVPAGQAGGMGAGGMGEGMAGGMEGGFGFGHEPRMMGAEPPSLESLVMDMTSPPCRWMESGYESGAIRRAGTNLVIRQTFTGHQEIVRLLNLLSDAAAEGSE
ncbi:MAG: sigma-70 family RNA polymerase sigma factor [Fuerstiella sp.]